MKSVLCGPDSRTVRNEASQCDSVTEISAAFPKPPKPKKVKSEDKTPAPCDPRQDDEAEALGQEAMLRNQRPSVGVDKNVFLYYDDDRATMNSVFRSIVKVDLSKDPVALLWIQTVCHTLTKTIVGKKITRAEFHPSINRMIGKVLDSCVVQNPQVPLS